jgi:hypothetical protein
MLTPVFLLHFAPSLTLGDERLSVMRARCQCDAMAAMVQLDPTPF